MPTAAQILLGDILPSDVYTPGLPLDKKGIHETLTRAVAKYPDKYPEMIKKLQDLGKVAGISFGGASFTVADLRMSEKAKARREVLKQQIASAIASLPIEQRGKKVIELVRPTIDAEREEIYQEAIKANNPLASQLAGAGRGNKASLARLLGSDGLYEDSQGRTVPIYVSRSYSQGLTPIQHMASTFGARRGVIAAKLCAFSETQVRMADGTIKQISVIQPGEWVLGADRAGKTFPVRVKNVFDNGLRDCYQYWFRRGQTEEFVSLIATEDHEILSVNMRANGEKGRVDVPTKMQLKRALTYRVPAKNTFSAIPPTGPGDNPAAAQLVDEPLAVLCGAMLGNGCMTAGTNGAYQLSTEDHLMVTELNVLLESFGARLNRAKNGPAHLLTMLPAVRDEAFRSRERGQAGVVIAKGSLCPVKRWLKRMIGEHYAHEKELPPEAWGWTTQSVIALFAGYFATDGCVYLNSGKPGGGISFVSTSKPLLEGLRDLAGARLGLWGSALSHTPAEQKENATHDQWTWCINHTEMQRRLIQLIAPSVPGIKRGRLHQLHSELSTAERCRFYGWKVNRKQPMGPLATWDIEVEHPDHMFVLANGLIIANSVAGSGYLSKVMTQGAHRLVVVDRDGPDQSEDRGLPVAAGDQENDGAMLARAVGGFKRNTPITPRVREELKRQGIDEILIRSPITSSIAGDGLYAMDVGLREDGLPATGRHVGIPAVHAVAEKVTQATLCLAVGTLVRIEGEAVAIEEAVVGTNVLGADRFTQRAPTPIVAVHVNGLRMVHRYLFRDVNNAKQATELLCSPDHEILLIDGQTCPIGQLDLDDVVPRQVEDHIVAARLWSKEIVGPRETFDLEIATDDHLFCLANGLIVSNSAKHSGGSAGQTKHLSAADLIGQTINPAKERRGWAIHSQIDGMVNSVKPAPQGGQYVTIEGVEHYVPLGQKFNYKEGDWVEAGDQLTDGIIDHAAVTEHKGIGEGRRAFVEAMSAAMASAGFKSARRNLELMSRGLMNRVRTTEEFGDYLPDDLVPYNEVEAAWKPREDARDVPASKAGGRYLERPVLHYSIGTRVTPAVQKRLDKFQIRNVLTHDKPPPFVPEVVRGIDLLGSDPDWQTRQLGGSIEKGLLEAAERGRESDVSGTSFVPGRAALKPFNRLGANKVAQLRLGGVAVESYPVVTPRPVGPVRRTAQDIAARMRSRWSGLADPLDDDDDDLQQAMMLEDEYEFED